MVVVVVDLRVEEVVRELVAVGVVGLVEVVSSVVWMFEWV